MCTNVYGWTNACNTMYLVVCINHECMYLYVRMHVLCGIYYVLCIICAYICVHMTDVTILADAGEAVILLVGGGGCCRFSRCGNIKEVTKR